MLRAVLVRLALGGIAVGTFITLLGVFVDLLKEFTTPNISLPGRVFSFIFLLIIGALVLIYLLGIIWWLVHGLPLADGLVS